MTIAHPDEPVMERPVPFQHLLKVAMSFNGEGGDELWEPANATLHLSVLEREELRTLWCRSQLLSLLDSNLGAHNVHADFRRLLKAEGWL